MNNNTTTQGTELCHGGNLYQERKAVGLDMYVCREAARGVVVGKELDLNEAKTQRGESTE